MTWDVSPLRTLTSGMSLLFDLMFSECVFQSYTRPFALPPGCVLMYFECVFQSARRVHRSQKCCVLMYFECVFQSAENVGGDRDSCVLMYFECVFQSSSIASPQAPCCVLMYFECVFQSPYNRIFPSYVVFWCILNVSFNAGLLSYDAPPLCFDVFWMCLSIAGLLSYDVTPLCFDVFWMCLSIGPHTLWSPWCCVLMYFECVFQWHNHLVDGTRVVFWCILNVSFNNNSLMACTPSLCFDVFWMCLSITAR